MVNKELIVPIDLFAINQPIFLADGDQEPKMVQYSLVYELPEVVTSLCQKYDVNKVHFFGSEDFLEPAIKKLGTLFQNIEIEVN